MIKVIAINSSNRKKNTFGLIVKVQKILENNNIEVEIINLYDYNIDDCIGCENCILNGECVLNDDVEEIMKKLVNCDGIILTSPVYLQAVSGKLKTFVDRTCKWFHRPEIYGKPVLVMSTTKGSGLKSTLKYLQKVVIQWGGINTGSIGRNIRNIEENISEKECEKFIKYLKMDKKDYKPSLESIINFQVQKMLYGFVSGLDEEYWKEKGWDKEIYYFNCKMNIFKQIIARSLNKVMSKIVKKAD